MSYRVYLTALASDQELDLFLRCAVVDPRITDIIRPVREISLLSVPARNKHSAQEIFTAARDSIDVMLETHHASFTEWVYCTHTVPPVNDNLAACSVGWTHTVPPANDNLAACSVALDVALTIDAWRAVRTTATVLAAAIMPHTATAVAALRDAKRADDLLFEADAQMCRSLRRRGICKIDAFGWLFSY